MTRTELTADAVKAKTHDLELYECSVVEVEEAGKRRPRWELSRVSRGESGKVKGTLRLWLRCPLTAPPFISWREEIDLWCARRWRFVPV